MFFFTADGSYNTDFWDKLQDSWRKLAENDGGEEHPWLNEFSDFYDDNTFTDYTFTEDNPMTDVTNPLEVGKEKLQQHDLPSAVLCFEAAVTKEPENVEAWQLLGMTQAENEQVRLLILFSSTENYLLCNDLFVCYVSYNKIQ